MKTKKANFISVNWGDEYTFEGYKKDPSIPLPTISGYEKEERRAEEIRREKLIEFPELHEFIHETYARHAKWWTVNEHSDFSSFLDFRKDYEKERPIHCGL